MVNFNLEFPTYVACDAGQYGRGGDTSCVACPANSTSTRASGYCPCIEGHFRYDISNIETECPGKRKYYTQIQQISFILQATVNLFYLTY